MRIALYDHESFRLHDTGPRHPERPARVDAAVRGVDASGLEVVRFEPSPIDTRDLLIIHDEEYVEELQRFLAAGGGYLDADTHAGPASWDAALRAAGAGLEAVETIRGGGADLAFLAVRPPGHHALHDAAMGFCLFNNIAITAAHLARDGERVAILDWDVHHGNGTQKVFEASPDVLYLSIHEYPFYPGTGRFDEIGNGRGQGTIINLPVPAGTCGDVYRRGVDRLIAPVLTQFDPGWVLVSAGYDAHRADPLASVDLESSDYRAMADAVATAVPRAGVVVFLEGGYDLQAIEESVQATIVGFAGQGPGRAPGTSSGSSVAWRMLDVAVATHSQFWDVR